jgi:ADP-ribose pyrophosphatase YjhB (NUDIX family)
MNEIYCQNCGKNGHVYHQCKMPITSYGIICFRSHPETGSLEYLMIRRKNTLGYIDFLRGKYSLHNKYYIINMLKQMTETEKESLKTKKFDVLWKELWNETIQLGKYKNEENISRDKFKHLTNGIGEYSLFSLIEESMQYEQWTEQEWGFPKGRRDYKETELECALREFSEETGYSSTQLTMIENILPFEEIFIGSNYKSYKHIYFLAKMDYQDSLLNDGFNETNEISKLDWKNYISAMHCIRKYNLEKKRVLTNVNQCLTIYSLYNEVV